MIEDLRNSPIDHASNLGPVIAYEIAKSLGIPAYTVDPIAVDEFQDIARITGLKEINRRSRFHALNTRYVAKKSRDAWKEDRRFQFYCCSSWWWIIHSSF